MDMKPQDHYKVGFHHGMATAWSIIAIVIALLAIGLEIFR